MGRTVRRLEEAQPLCRASSFVSVSLLVKISSQGLLEVSLECSFNQGSFPYPRMQIQEAAVHSSTGGHAEQHGLQPQYLLTWNAR